MLSPRIPSRFRKVTQGGNALFLILIAVALFAALSYAVTQSGRGSGSASREQGMLNAAQAVSYANTVAQAITRMTLTGGCTDGQISFDTPALTGYDANPYSPSDNTCHVFHPSGGGLSYIKPPAGLNSGEDWAFLSYRIYALDGDEALDAESSELLMVLPNVTDAVCRQLNAQLTKVSSYATTPPFANNSFTDPIIPFEGDYWPFPVESSIAAVPDPDEFNGRTMDTGICVRPVAGAGVGQNWYVHILKARKP